MSTPCARPCGPHGSVSNNVSVGGAAGAVYVYPYWDSVHDVIVAGNTLWGDADRAVRFDDAVAASLLVGNVALPEGWTRTTWAASVPTIPFQ